MKKADFYFLTQKLFVFGSAFAFLFFIVVDVCNAQEENMSGNKVYQAPPPPNSASLGQFGQTPVDLFTGGQQISIPLYEMKTKYLSVPIKLGYTPGGIKVKESPTWVGLGWNLEAGGAIVRRKHGVDDENLGGFLEWPEDNGGVTTYPRKYLELGYYHVKGNLANDNWASTATNLSVDQNPDEFIFNVNGLSGSFFMDHNGNWKVKSKQNLHLKIESEITSLASLGGQGQWEGWLPISFLNFVITDEHGNRYKFGGTRAAVEFSKPAEMSNWMALNGTYGVTINGVQTFQAAHVMDYLQNFPVAWYLTEIESINGEKISFNYTQDGAAFSASLNIYDSTGSGVHLPAPSQQPINYSTSYPTFLSSIVSPNETLIFNKSLSSYLQVRYNQYNGNTANGYYKLDKIEVRNNSNSIIRSVDLSYSPNTSTRMKLTGLSINSGLANAGNYSFAYNPMSLPDYLSDQTDHWGYYNGKSAANVTEIQNFYNSKEPDELFMQAEILTQIQYPTGGKSFFYYEPKYYAKVAKSYPFTIEDKTGYADGVRVFKIVDEPVIGEQQVREFFYTASGFTNGLSSGVLGGVPVYHYSYAGLREIYQNTSVATSSSTFGKEVTYSRVVEKNSKGYRVFTYSNLDNGYHDIASPNSYPAFVGRPFSRRELSRGNLLSEENFSTSFAPVSKKEFTYNEDLTQFVRAFGQGPEGGVVFSYGPYASFVNYTFSPFVTKSVETIFNSGNAVTNTTEFDYNSFSNLIKNKRSYGSDGKIYQTSYKYAMDFPPNTMVSPNRKLAYYDMLVRNMKMPIETTQSVITNGEQKVVHSQFNNYVKDPNTGLIRLKNILDLNLQAPVSDFVESSIVQDYWDTGTISYYREILQYDPRYKDSYLFNRYDNSNNLEEFQQSLGSKTVYLYSYKKQFIIAEIKNADYQSIESLLGGSTAIENFKNLVNPDRAAVESFLAPLKTGLPNALITSYSYNPPVGMVSMTDPKGKATYFGYDGFQRLISVKDQNGHVIKSYDYHFKQP